MQKRILNIATRFLNKFGLALVQQQQKQVDYSGKALAATKLVNIIPILINEENTETAIWDFISFAGKKIMQSNAQLMQDLFVLHRLNEKSNGYFIEFGAADGIHLSNTLLLEKKYGWKGIVAEPCKTWHKKLFENRNCNIDTRCVWDKSGETITFNETNNPEISTIHNFSASDSLAAQRKKGLLYEVATISLNDLLQQNDCPLLIDYLSIDTEGSEYQILSSLNFEKYKIRIITVEHNYSPLREKIHALLSSHGFKRVFEPISLYDDWYTNQLV